MSGILRVAMAIGMDNSRLVEETMTTALASITKEGAIVKPRSKVVSVRAKWSCFICGEETYERIHDEVNGHPRGSNPWICAKHVDELLTQFAKVFLLKGFSSTEYGLDLGWTDLKEILGRFKYDAAARAWFYYVTDKQVREAHVNRANR